jgi:hypothetical protein
MRDDDMFTFTSLNTEELENESCNNSIDNFLPPDDLGGEFIIKEKESISQQENVYQKS